MIHPGKIPRCTGGLKAELNIESYSTRDSLIAPWFSYVDHPRCVALLEVEEHRRLVEVRHHHHVLDLVKLGGVHGEHLVLPHGQGLQR